MRALVADPPRQFVEIDIPRGLGALQTVVRGGIEVVYLGRDDIGLVINEESLLNGSMPNREANRLFRRVIGYGNLLCGPVMIVGQDGDEFTDVPSAVAEMVRLGSADAFARSVRPG